MTKVLIGKLGFLFLDHDSNSIIKQHCGQYDIGGALQPIYEVHKTRQEFVERFGGAYIHCVAPNKETVAKDLLPDGIDYQKYGLSPVNAYCAFIGDFQNLIFFRPDLFDNFLNTRSYYATDTHWTFRGAKAYIAEALRYYGFSGKSDEINEIPLRQDNIHFVGDLGQHVHAPGEIQEYLQPSQRNASLIFDNKITNEGRFFHFKNKLASGKVFLLIDSFGHWAIDFLSEVFAETFIIHTADLDFDVLSRFKPDLFIHIQAERFFPRVPRDRASFEQLISREEKEKHSNAAGVEYLRNAGLL